jgi:hypothetical protein
VDGNSIVCDTSINFLFKPTQEMNPTIFTDVHMFTSQPGRMLLRGSQWRQESLYGRQLGSRDLSLNLLLFCGRLSLLEDPEMRLVGNIAPRKVFGVISNSELLSNSV